LTEKGLKTSVPRKLIVGKRGGGGRVSVKHYY